MAACLVKLSDEDFAQPQFRALFFKKVETFRQRRPFLEVSYFLLYSGLESYARAVLNDRTILKFIHADLQIAPAI